MKVQRRSPAERLRYILRKLEQQEIDAGRFPLLLHEAQEALDQLLAPTAPPDHEFKAHPYLSKIDGANKDCCGFIQGLEYCGLPESVHRRAEKPKETAERTG